MVWWFFTDYKTSPTKVVLSCFGLLVGLWQLALNLKENPFFPTRGTLNAICFVGLLGEQENLDDVMSTLALVW